MLNDDDVKRAVARYRIVLARRNDWEAWQVLLADVDEAADLVATGQFCDAYWAAKQELLAAKRAAEEARLDDDEVATGPLIGKPRKAKGRPHLKLVADQGRRRRAEEY